jgi:hypothetical protein
MFTSQSRARTIQLRKRLATTRKGDQSAAIYYNKMKGFTNEMAAAGKPMEDDDFISYVLAGLDQNYNSFLENIASKTEITLDTVYSQLLVAEARLELQHASQYQSSSSMNFASRGRGGGRGGFGHGFGSRGEPVSSSAPKPVCQLCKKTGHTMLQCWKHFDRNYTGEDKSVNNADGPGYNVDPAWYSDTQEPPITLPASWINLLCERSTQARNRFMPQMKEVCKLPMLVILHFIPFSELFLLRMFFMFLAPRKNLVSIHRFT